MTTTTFQNGVTPVDANWLNDVDEAVYQANSGITGSTARTLINKLSDTVSVKEDRKSTRLNSSHSQQSRMPSSA